LWKVPHMGIAEEWEQVVLAVMCQVPVHQERWVGLALEAVDRERLLPVGNSWSDGAHLHPARLHEVGAVRLLLEAMSVLPAVGHESGGSRCGSRQGPGMAESRSNAPACHIRNRVPASDVRGRCGKKGE